MPWLKAGVTNDRLRRNWDHTVEKLCKLFRLGCFNLAIKNAFSSTVALVIQYQRRFGAACG